ncbi:MAG TPA: type II toxin-antitoxin system RelE/ParE family toxin [Roseomonas sp.]|jgi:putative addiction module killer protein
MPGPCAGEPFQAVHRSPGEAWDSRGPPALRVGWSSTDPGPGKPPPSDAVSFRILSSFPRPKFPIGYPLWLKPDEVRPQIPKIEVRRTADFDRWLSKLRNQRAVARIAARIERLEEGNAGDAAPVGQGVSEMRIHYGPGYRVYFVQRGAVLFVLLCGGDKSTQQQDIKQAIEMAARVEG